MHQSDFRYRVAMFSTIIYLAAFMAIVAPAPNAFGQSDPIPKEIVDLKMGDTSAAVIAKISPSGTHSMDNSSDQGGRPKVIWIPSENPHYKDLLFQFTEKDRLYLIRFNIKQAEKDEIQALKKSFFDTQKFLWEEPLKMKHKDNDILLYIKESGPDCFFDFFNRKTGERSFELFNRAVSVEDRPPKAEEQKAENQSADESSSNGPTPEKLDAKSPEPGSTPVSGEKPDPAKVQTQPQKEGE